MKSIRVAGVGLRQERRHFNSLVEFAGDMPEVGRGDLETFSLGNAVPQFISSLNVLIAESQIAQVAVRSPEQKVGQSEFGIEFDRAFELRD